MKYLRLLYNIRKVRHHFGISCWGEAIQGKAMGKEARPHPWVDGPVCMVPAALARERAMWREAKRNGSWTSDPQSRGWPKTNRQTDCWNGNNGYNMWRTVMLFSFLFGVNCHSLYLPRSLSCLFSAIEFSSMLVRFLAQRPCRYSAFDLDIFLLPQPLPQFCCICCFNGHCSVQPSCFLRRSK